MKKLLILIIYIIIESSAIVQSCWGNNISKITIAINEAIINEHFNCPYSEEVHSKIENIWIAATESAQRKVIQVLYLGKSLQNIFKFKANRRIGDYRYQKATRENYINTCFDSLTECSAGKFVKEVQQIQKNTLDSIKKVKITIEGFDDYKKYRGPPLNFETAIKAYLEYAGIDITSGDTTNCDTELDISGGVEKLIQRYDLYNQLTSCSFGLSRRFSLHSVKNSFEVIYDSGEKLIRTYTKYTGDYVFFDRSLQRELLRPQTLSGYQKLPLPEKCVYLDFIDQIYKDLIWGLWGLKSLNAALYDESIEVRCKAAVALGKMLDIRAILILDSLRSNSDEKLRSCSEWAFQNIRNNPNTIEILLSALVCESDTAKQVNLINILKILKGEYYHYYLTMVNAWIQNRGTENKNELTVFNNSGEVATIKIKDIKKDLFIRKVILRNKEEFTFRLTNGIFKEYVRFGDSEPFIYIKGEGFKFLVPKEKYTIANLTLKSILGGNYDTNNCTPEEFNK
jgi:hypothetical protein